jgi:hypothetical protein
MELKSAILPMIPRYSYTVSSAQSGRKKMGGGPIEPFKKPHGKALFEYRF